MSPASLLAELEPKAAELLERHLSQAKEWFPHELVPYSRGRDFVKGESWTECETDVGGTELSQAVRSALFLNLLTEDNLPYYFRDIENTFGVDGAFGVWVRRWTAEEGRHSIVMRDYMTATRAIDPVELERGRMIQVSGGEAPAPTSPMQGMVYVTLQELATRISHRNTGKLLGDTAGYEIMARVAADENLHFLFYRDLTTAAMEIDPSGFVEAVEDVVQNFAMPGLGIPNFAQHSKLIAAAGIYDAQLHHDQILVPVILNHWRIESLTGLTAAAEAARDRVMTRIGRIGKLARTLAERRERSESLALV